MRSLSLVDSSEVLRGQGPPAFEKLARTAVPGSSEHVGLLSICAALAGRCIGTCVPPSAQIELLAGLQTAHEWIAGRATEKQVNQARVSCFQAVSAVEKITRRAVAQAQKHLDSERAAGTPLDPHADHVVTRYATLAAHFTVSSICHTLDAVNTPDVALEVLQDVEGARAYQAAGLGSARHPMFRKAAWTQAEWETAKLGLGAHTSTAAHTASISVQVFHEYLGGRWRMHSDAERIKNTDFLDWALSGQKP